MLPTSAFPLWPGSHLHWQTLTNPVTELDANEVFVFGSNADGFHGAGSAGTALRGCAANSWRRDPKFAAMRAAPAGSDARRGVWAVFGIARGHQVGLQGQSYAIQTIAYPGEREPPDQGAVARVMNDIYRQLRHLVRFAEAHPDLRFTVTRLGAGYSWMGEPRMGSIWHAVHNRAPRGLPASFRFVRHCSPHDRSFT